MIKCIVDNADRFNLFFDKGKKKKYNLRRNFYNLKRPMKQKRKVKNLLQEGKTESKEKKVLFSISLILCLVSMMFFGA